MNVESNPIFFIEVRSKMTEMGMSHGKRTSYFVALPPREWGQHLVNHGLSKKKNGG
jgi:hypothetical protein